MAPGHALNQGNAGRGAPWLRLPPSQAHGGCVCLTDPVGVSLGVSVCVSPNVFCPSPLGEE